MGISSWGYETYPLVNGANQPPVMGGRGLFFLNEFFSRSLWCGFFLVFNPLITELLYRMHFLPVKLVPLHFLATYLLLPMEHLLSRRDLSQPP